jgi:23S rRNA (uracil1939-C5)-methyltransferase
MINLVSEYFSNLKKSTILDLYCGCGNFSLFLAKEGAEVDGVDSNKRAIKEAVYNAKINSVEGCRFIKADINKLGEKDIKGSYGGILLNPPRSGCSKNTVKRIVDAKPSVIVYVSCNPATLARDLKALISSGYKVEEVQPVDMFPQTYHVEALVKLTKNK